MPNSHEIRSVSDSRRDAARHHRLLLALERATDEIRRMERDGHPDIDEVLDRLLPDLAAALNAKQAFVAVLREDEGRGEKWFELTVVYPRKDLLGHRLEWSGLLQQLIKDGKPIVIDPLGGESRDPIAGLETFDARSAILVRTQVADQVRIVGICNKADPDLGPYLAADRMALDNIVELVAMGTRVGERRRRELEIIQETSAAINSSLDVQEVLGTIVDSIIQVTGCQKSATFLVDKDRNELNLEMARGLSKEYVLGSRSLEVGPKTRAAVIFYGAPIAVRDTEAERRFTVYKELGRQEGFRAFIDVPMKIKEETIGAITAYYAEPHDFSKEEIDLLTTFANHAAIAIQNAQLRRRELESILATSDAIRATLDLDDLLPLITSKASEVFGAPVTSLMFWDEAEENLVIKASCGLSDEYVQRQRISKERVCAAATSNGGFHPLVTPDVRLEPFGQRNLYEKEHLCTVLSTPLLISDKLIGVLNIYSKNEPREFTTGDIELATIFANQAATAIDIAQLHQQTKQRGEQLAALDQIALDIAKRLETKELLRAIVERATELVQGTGGGVYLFIGADEAFRLEAVYGIPSELEGIRIEKDKGVIGQVLRTKQSVAVADYQHWSGRLRILDEHKPTAVVGAPIMSGDHFLGAIAVHNTKEGRAFGEAEKELLLRLGKHVAVALDNARAYADLREVKDYQERLIGTSLDGIIACDKEGWIIVFNDGAEQILGYKRDEVLDRKKRIDELYWTPQDPRKINSLLHDQERLKNYETAVKNKNGQRIPIMLSATLLRDSKGNPIGSVGFFKDLRPIKLLLDATNTVANAQSLKEGLDALAAKMVTGLTTTFCHIMLVDDSRQEMEVRAAYPIPRSQSSDLQWDPQVGKLIGISGVPVMEHLLRMEKPCSFRKGDIVEGIDVVEHIQKEVALEGTLESALVIPLRTGEKVLGLCTLGEMRNWERSPFSREKMALARSIGAHAAILIDRMRSHEQTTRRLRVLSKLYEVLSALRTNPDRDHNLNLITSTLMDLFGADTCTVGLFNPELTHLKFVAGQGLEKLPDYSTRVLPPDLLSHVCANSEPIVIPNLGDRPDLQKVLVRPDLRSFLIMPLLGRERPLGVITVGSVSEIRLSPERRNMLEALSGQAILAIEETEKRAQQLDSLLRISRTIISPQGLQTVLQEIVENVVNGLGVEVTTLYAYDAEKEEFEMPVTAGPLYHEEEMRSPSTKDSVVYRVLQRQEPYIVIDVEHDELVTREFTRREKIKSCVVFPLRVSGKPVGVMFVNYRKSHYFTPSEVDTFQVFANQAAVAIEYARLYRSVTERLETANAMAWIGTASSLWAHEVQQKTFSIWTDAASLRDHMSDSKAQEILARIEAEVASLGDVIPRLPSSDMEEAVELDKVLADVRERRARELQDHGISVESNLAEMPPVWANYQWLVEAFDCLTKNAIRAMPGGGTLTFTGELGGDNVFIEVIDTGKGFPEHVRSQLYKGRVAGVDAEGMGIGLLLVKTIFNRYGGDIALPHLDERGNVFPIKLPIAKQNSEG